MLPFDYTKALYRKDNYGKPNVWFACPNDGMSVTVYHGILGGTITTEYFKTMRLPEEDVRSRFDAKRKSGYKYLSEIRDSHSLPVEEELIQFITTYMPDIRTNAEGKTLAMLAKTFDNENNKLFKKQNWFLAQWKINGLRCFIRAEETNDLFKPIRLIFQSREGEIWNSLPYLEEELLSRIPDWMLKQMCYEQLVLDGEVYIPGFSVNQINHAVKDIKAPENRLVQYWCYDVAIDGLTAESRHIYLYDNLKLFIPNWNNKQEHLANKSPFVVLPTQIVTDGSKALTLRDKYIDLGFEGLIMRNPIMDYQFGKRNLSMIKYKKATDGIFTIIDIYPEGNKRADLPLFKCINDINNATFECHIGGSFEYQRKFLENPELYIGRKLFIEYGERSGVNQLPFHIKTVKLHGTDSEI